MFKNDRWRLAATFAPPLMLLSIATIVACRDTVTSRPDRVSASSFAQYESTDSSARSQLHARNKYDWVGVAHNKAIDDFRKELRKPGPLPHGFCRSLLSFLTQQERMPSDRKLDDVTRARFGNDAIADVPVCTRTVARYKGTSNRRETSAAAMWLASQSTEAAQLNQDVLAAIDASAGSTELASRLGAILDAATALEATERDLIFTVSSVAQSSFEYWEANGDAFSQEVANEYDDCMLDRANLGYSFEEAQYYCLESPSEPFSVLPGDVTVRLASRLTTPCETSPSGSIRAIGKADATGAWNGFWAGLFAGGHAVEGALLGAAGGSIGTGVVIAMKQWWCLVT